MLHKIKQQLKYITSHVLFLLGFLTYFRKKKLRNKVVVLMYHRVLKHEETANSFSNSGIIVNDKTFESQIKYLKKHFNIISLDTFIYHVKNKIPFTNSTCLITFDDGWIDNYKNAFPILQKYNVPALIFLPIDYIDSNNLFWQERLTFYLHRIATSRNDDKGVLIEKGVIDTPIFTMTEARKHISNYITRLKSFDNDELNELLNFFSDYIINHNIQYSDNGIDKYINWDQVKIMHEKGIKFGSHAISHRLLSKYPENIIAHEVSSSKSILESTLQNNIDSIAYPNGDFNTIVINKVVNSGYKVAFCTKQGYFSAGDDPYQIKRINIHQNATNNIPMFLCRILMIF